MTEPMALRTFRSNESGFAIIEAVVSAAVLAMVAMAVLAGLDAAGASSAREKSRAVAASLAEQDQERMRSMSLDELSTLAKAGAAGSMATVPVGGADYSVRSNAEWITDDSGGTPSCGNSSKNNEYLHITTTVTSAIVGVRVKPIKIDSLVAPSLAYSSDARHSRREGRQPQRRRRAEHLGPRDEHQPGVLPAGTARPMPTAA